MKTRSYDQATAYAIVATLDPSEQVRRWGFEIESQIIGEQKARADWRDYDGLAFTSDGSLSGSECECDCSDCYHSCNCDACDRSDYLDHCSDCGTNEVCSEQPVTTPTLDRWAEFLKRLESYWVPVEHYGENWGGHLHVEARDLTKRQAQAVVLIGERLFDLAPEWFTGEPDRYNEKQDRGRLQEFATSNSDRNHTHRASWVSVYNLRQSEPMPYTIGEPHDYRKTTIEFRRFRSTADRQLIEFRALVCRKLVEYAKNNASIYWLTSAKNWESILQQLGV